MSAQRSCRILRDAPENGNGGVDAVQILHTRRRRTMVALLSEFERTIEPLIPPGHDDEIKAFKGAIRKRLNGDAFEAASLLKGGIVNAHAVRLAEELTSDDQTED